MEQTMFKEPYYIAHSGDVIWFRGRLHAVRDVSWLRRRVTLLPVHADGTSDSHFVVDGKPEKFRLSTVQDESTFQQQFTVLKLSRRIGKRVAA
jgi:hypothetical protein